MKNSNKHESLLQKHQNQVEKHRYKFFKWPRTTLVRRLSICRPLNQNSWKQSEHLRLILVLTIQATMKILTNSLKLYRTLGTTLGNGSRNWWQDQNFIKSRTCHSHKGKLPYINWEINLVEVPVIILPLEFEHQDNEIVDRFTNTRQTLVFQNDTCFWINSDKILQTAKLKLSSNYNKK